MPPDGPGHFYPFWTRARVDGACVWEFGNMRNGNTFGGESPVGPGRPAHARRIHEPDPLDAELRMSV